MIENFLRPPRSLAEFAADTLRGLGVLGVVLVGVVVVLHLRSDRAGRR
ncbi:hypothetical protein ACHABQ_13005 [Nesterenkonia aurantiaca]